MTDLFADGDEWDGSLDDMEPQTAEPEAVAEPVEDVVEEPAAEVEPAADDPPRGPDGKFIPRNLQVDDPDVEALLEKYQGDPMKALKAAAEAQRHIGTLNNELGQLRAIAEDVAALKENAARPLPPHTVITEDLIDRDPAAATQLAYEQGNETALRVAYEAWKMEDPATAAVWVVTQQMQARDQAYQQEIQNLRAQIGPVAQSQEDRVFAEGVKAIAANDPDVHNRIIEGAQTLPEEVATALYSLLESGTASEKLGAYRALAELTKGRTETSATPPADVRQQAREQALEAERAIAEASVVSATATKTEPVGKTAADLIGDEWAAQEKPYIDGWNF